MTDSSSAFQRINGGTKLLQVVLGLSVVASLITILLSLIHFEHFESSAPRSFESVDQIMADVNWAYALRQITQVHLLIEILLWVLGFIVSLIWLHLIAKSINGLALSRPRFSPWVSVGCFLAPGVNLVLPFFVLREMWHRSHMVLGSDVKNTPIVIYAWWLATLLLVSFSILVGFPTAEYEVLDNDSPYLQITIASRILVVAVCVLFGLVAQQIVAGKKPSLGHVFD
ncbi:MAG: DUF4328 domain-containing protein [Proteobacteria bacterium]|nr:DUF4328 domain-containing protein [Pseudomonadota bacterium]